MIKYYYLHPDEIIKQGDEFRNTRFGEASAIWLPCTDSVGGTQRTAFPLSFAYVTIRRAIKITQLGNQL